MNSLNELSKASDFKISTRVSNGTARRSAPNAPKSDSDERITKVFAFGQEWKSTDVVWSGSGNWEVKSQKIKCWVPA